MLRPNFSGETQVQDQRPPTAGLPEEDAKYFEVPGARPYTGLHRAKDPVGRVLLVGPSASEVGFCLPQLRPLGSISAERRIEVLRFDDRGMSESAGVFEDGV